MMRITEKQRVMIVRLYQGGSSIPNLAESYETTIPRIEAIIRDACRAQAAKETR